MKIKSIFLPLFVSLIAFSGCEKIIELDVPESEPRLIIESGISTDTAFWKVKLTMTQAYFNQDDKGFVNNALVTISDNVGNIDTLFLRDTGLYVSKTTKTCVVGRAYTLRVLHNGVVHQATEVCPYQEPISFLMSFELPERNGFIDPGFYVFEKAKENEAEGDFYLWKVYRNDSLQDDFGYVLDTDEFRETSYFNINIDPDDPLKDQDKNILPRPFPFEFEVGDTARVEQYRVSKAYYYFLVELQNQVSRSGTPFDPPPVNPRTNITGGGFGFFSVSNVSKDSLVVK